MVGIIRKGIPVPVARVIDDSPELLTGRLRRISIICRPKKQVFDRRCSGQAGSGRVSHHAGGKVDRPAQRLMDTSDIQDQYVVDIDPHVVIAGEPEYHRISIRKDPFLRHAELGIHLHTCIEVRYSLDTVNVLIGSPIV